MGTAITPLESYKLTGFLRIYATTFGVVLKFHDFIPSCSQRFLRISAIHHNMTHFISESTVHEYQYSIEHFPETSSLMTSGYGTNYDFSICSRSPHSSLSL